MALTLAQGPSLDALIASSRQFDARLQAAAPGLRISGPDRLLPPIDEQAETGRILTTVAHDVPAIQARLRAVAADLGFRPGAFDAFLERLPRLLDPEQRLTYQGYLDHGLGDIVSRYVARGPDGYTAVGYVEVGSDDDLAKARAAAAVAGAEVILTGVPVVNAALAARFGPQFVWAMAVGSIVVFGLILITFRSVRLTLLALMPTALGLIWAAAVLAQSGVSLDLFSVFAVLTLIGIGVDYGIHLVHRAATEPGQLDLALARVAPANIVAAGIARVGVRIARRVDVSAAAVTRDRDCRRTLHVPRGRGPRPAGDADGDIAVHALSSGAHSADALDFDEQFAPAERRLNELDRDVGHELVEQRPHARGIVRVPDMHAKIPQRPERVGAMTGSRRRSARQYSRRSREPARRRHPRDVNPDRECWRCRR